MNNFIVELGHIALVSALVLSVYQFVIVFFKNEENYINKLQGKKAVGDVTDDTHISTACRGAFCGIFFENNERDILINAINESGLKRIIWVSENDTNKNILELDNLIYLKHKNYKGVEEKILDLESQETVEYGLIDLDT